MKAAKPWTCYACQRTNHHDAECCLCGRARRVELKQSNAAEVIAAIVIFAAALIGILVASYWIAVGF